MKRAFADDEDEDNFIVPEDYGTDQESISNNLFVLSAVGGDKQFNVGQRELPWYGLWIRVLRVFERSAFTFALPQYPLWLREENDNRPVPGGLNPRDLKKFDFAPSVQFQASLSRVDLLPNYSPPTSPLAHKSAHQPRLMMELPEDVMENFYSKTISKVEDRHKITDFGVIHVILQPDHVTATKPSNIILNILVPLVTEVKLYRCYADDHNHEESRASRIKMLLRAQEDVDQQVEYLFSQRRQPKAIAIAAAGPFWRWKVRRRAVVPIRATNAGTSDGYYETERELKWSETLLIGTPTSNATLDRIQSWVDGFNRRAKQIPSNRSANI